MCYSVTSVCALQIFANTFTCLKTFYFGLFVDIVYLFFFNLVYTYFCPSFISPCFSIPLLMFFLSESVCHVGIISLLVLLELESLWR